MRKAGFVILLMLALTCKKKNDFTYQVPQEFEPFVQKFITEGKSRGHDIIINNLIIQYDNSGSFPYCAASNTVSSSNDAQKIITVNGHVCWQNNTQLETLIFHELGHCILG